MKGPVDVHDVQVMGNGTCGSYLCGPVEQMAHIIGNAASSSASVNSDGGYWGVVGRD